MPHKPCSVCIHPDRQDVDRALMSGASVREVAKQFGIGKSSIERHWLHARRKSRRLDVDELARIDAEIKKLHHSETAARRRKDGALALRIAREIRQWHETRAKAVAMFDANRHGAEESTITPQEALALAMGVVESRLNEPEVKAWIHALNERVCSEETQQQQPTESVETERVADE